MKKNLLAIAIISVFALSSCGTDQPSETTAVESEASNLDEIMKFADREGEENYSRRNPRYPRGPRTPAPFPPSGPNHGQIKQQVIVCKSFDYQPNTCVAKGRIYDIYVQTRLSKSQCIRGRSYGFHGRRLWVNQGCQGVFKAQVMANGNGGTVEKTRLTCESRDYGTRSCYTRKAIRNISLVTKLSKTTCVRGRNYGFDRNRVWVRGGCRAVFDVYLRRY